MDVCRELYCLVSEACSRCTADSIALSGGLDSTILAYLLQEKRPKGIAIIANDFVATDLVYCQTASSKFGMPLSINYTSTVDILNAVEETIKILGNFNDIEIRNCAVMYMAIKWAKENGHSGIITGDGADELFAGYDFLLGKPLDELEKELCRIRDIMHFPALLIGEKLGVAIESPFLDREITEFAKNIPVDMLVKSKDGRVYGKWILRKTFEKVIPQQIAWRPKSPMQDGAGTAGLTGLFDSTISNDIFESKKNHILKKEGVTVRTKESLHYYEVYKRIHGQHPRCKSGRACSYCGYSIGDSKFCRMCGAFPV